MSWLHPTFWWVLLAAPLVAGLFWWAVRQRTAALDRLGDADLVAQLAPQRTRLAGAAILVLATLFMGSALLGPRIGLEEREVEQEGIDLVIVLDASLSMLAEDVAPNRLLRAKAEIRTLLDNLHGHRVGLVLFAGDAFVQCPLTTDFGAVRLFLDAAEPDLMGFQGSNIPHALQMAQRAFTPPSEPSAPSRSRAILLVSDGENHIQGLDAAAEELRAEGIELYTAGVGTPDGARIPLEESGRPAGYKQDRQGQTVHTRLEEATLRNLASSPDHYFRIERTNGSLRALPDLLQQMEQSLRATERYESYSERFQWPLALALLLLAAERLFPYRRMK